ncbi:AP-5 complex subunit sigma-1, putative [Plasmodium ovale]|uniref:AP-5 complex subunit sigma-1, putative n=1 Tax=Plasmodium ovale TaxID=36330 RepID=A0A1D3TGK0_PLAOA|nr:AP-5 complex subunit sigma-1, putative [Plasmodium ovale]
MVYGIIIHSSECEQDFYFSTYYDVENNDDNQHGRQKIIISRVIEEIKYYEEDKEKSAQVSKNNKEKYLDLFGVFLPKSTISEMKIDNEGFFRITDTSIFANNINVMWKVLNKICYTLILFAHENIHLADYFLCTFIHASREHCNKMKKTSKDITNPFNPDTLLAILYFFLPKGQLMFINDNHAKTMHGEIYKFLEDKTKVKPK